MTPKTAPRSPLSSSVIKPGIIVWYGLFPGARQFGCAPVGGADDGVSGVDHAYRISLYKGLEESKRV